MDRHPESYVININFCIDGNFYEVQVEKFF